MDDDDWQEMPVVRETAAASSSSSDEEGRKYGGSRKKKAAQNAFSARHAFKHGRTNSAGYGTVAAVGGSEAGQLSGATNATGRHLDIDDARGYSWRAKPEGLGDAGGMSAAKKESKAERRARLAKQKNKKAARKGHEDSASSVSSSDSGGDENEDGARGYTQLRLDDDVEAEEINAATDYLFTGGAGGRGRSGRTGLDEVDDVGATPHSQLNTTKNLLSEGQKIAYVGLVSLAAKMLVRKLERVPGKDLKAAIGSADEWRLRVMARLYQHMDIEGGEQRMIESLAEHGVLISDLAPSLVTTQTVDNPDFDPQALQEREEEEERQRQEDAVNARLEALQKKAEEEGESKAGEAEDTGEDAESGSDFDGGDLGETRAPQKRKGRTGHARTSSRLSDGDIGDEEGDIASFQSDKAEQTVIVAAGTAAAAVADQSATLVDPNTAARIDSIGETLDDGSTKVTPMGLTSQPQTIDTLPSALEGVTTELSSADKTITLDLRWTVLCDLFLVLTADSVYDSRSRVLLEQVAEELGLTWMDVTKFEKRVTDALEIEEGVAGSLKGKKAVRKRAELAQRRRMVMMGLATVGGGLVIGLSAGLMAPLIGVGLGAALGTMGIGGTSAFLGGVGGAAIITSTGTVAGAALGGTGMSKRTKTVSTFEFKPIHNNKRVNCIIAVPGFMSGPLDDPRLPFSVVDSIMGDIFSLLWEPDMMQEMGNAIFLLWSEALVQGVQQVLAATIAGGLVGALALPLWLTKLGYFIDNPWSNALDRAHACGLILADVLSKRKMGVRPITLVGFSLGARVIFYALVELARTKKYGIVQNVYLIGAPITANDKTWKEARSVVAGRFVNAYSRTDWILGWLFRATTGGLRTIAGLHPVERVPEVENVDVTKTVPGHLQYRAFMPLVLDQLGFRTTAEYFDEPEDLDKIPERELVYDQPLEEERKLKTVKTATGGFGRIFRRTAGGPASESGSDVATGGSAQPSRRPSVYDEDDDDDLPPREEPPSLRVSIDVDKSPRSSMALSETERALAELRESGIVVRELESSLPTLAVRTGPVAPPRRGSKLKDSISMAALKGEEDDNDDDKDDDVDVQQSHDSTYAALGAAPTLTVSDADAPETPEDDSTAYVASQSAQSQSSRGRLAPTPSYARPFGSTTFDANGLPPSAPSISSSGEVNLSFGESYEEDKVAEQQADDGDLDNARQPYGLSAEAARELAMQFQSAGMSDAGALAAARMAQNFEAMDESVRKPSLPTIAYGTAGEADPWGAGGVLDASPSSSSNVDTVVRSRAVSDAELSPSKVLAVPATTHAWNHNSENPWG